MVTNNESPTTAAANDTERLRIDEELRSAEEDVAARQKELEELCAATEELHYVLAQHPGRIPAVASAATTKEAKATEEAERSKTKAEDKAERNKSRNALSLFPDDALQYDTYSRVTLDLSHLLLHTSTTSNSSNSDDYFDNNNNNSRTTQPTTYEQQQ